MIRRIALAAVAVALVGLGGTPSGFADEAKEGTAKLFNGKDLSGWKVYLASKDAKPEDTFTVKDGVIHCTGKPAGYIITEKDYGDYVLELEWRWPDKPGNSGVFMHVSGEDKIWPKGVEAQLHSGNAGDFWLVGGFKLKVDSERKRGARRFVRLKAGEKIEKPVGEWNKYKITCAGDKVILEVNGQKVNMGTGAGATKGKILLQSEGAPIEFRNITLTPVNAK